MVHRVTQMANRVLGVIGGSGIYDLDGLRDVEELSIETPFGAPSGPLVRGRLGDTTMVFRIVVRNDHRVIVSGEASERQA